MADRYTVQPIPDSPMYVVVNGAGQRVLVDTAEQAQHVADALNAAPVPTDAPGLRDRIIAAIPTHAFIVPGGNGRDAYDVGEVADRILAVLAASQPVPTEPRCTCGTSCHFDCDGCGCAFHSQPVPTDVPGLREAAQAEACPMCGRRPNARLRKYLATVNEVPLAASPDAPRVAGLDVEEAMRLALLYVFQAKRMTPMTAIAVIRALAQDGWGLARLSDIGDTATPATSDEP